MPPNKRLPRTRRYEASLVKCVGSPLKRSVRLLLFREDCNAQNPCHYCHFNIGTRLPAVNSMKVCRPSEGTNQDARHMKLRVEVFKSSGNCH